MARKTTRKKRTVKRITKRRSNKKTTKKHQHLVKREGHLEHYDERKVYASVYAASLSCHLKKIDAENIANGVCIDIRKWMKNRDQTSSDQIFKNIIKALKTRDKEIAFMYETHRDIS